MSQKPELDPKVAEARAKLAERFGDCTRLGGAGTQRRKKKAPSKAQVPDDKKLKSMIKKFNVKPLSGIKEVNMFKSDNRVLHFKNPEVQASFSSNTFVVTGKGEQKSIKELLPDIIADMGPKQFESMFNLIKNSGAGTEGIKESTAEEEGDIPNLVNQNFEDASKQEAKH